MKIYKEFTPITLFDKVAYSNEFWFSYEVKKVSYNQNFIIFEYTDTFTTHKFGYLLKFIHSFSKVIIALANIK